MDTAIDLAVNPSVEPPQPIKKKPRGNPWNAETAKIMSARGVAARKAPKPPLQPLIGQVTVIPHENNPYFTEADKKRCIRRSEGHLQRLYGLLEGAISGNVRELGEEGECLIIDSKGIKALADSVRSMEMIFWRYAGIPGEGTLKPVQPKAKDSRFDGLPVRPL